MSLRDATRADSTESPKRLLGKPSLKGEGQVRGKGFRARQTVTQGSELPTFPIPSARGVLNSPKLGLILPKVSDVSVKRPLLRYVA